MNFGKLFKKNLGKFPIKNIRKVPVDITKNNRGKNFGKKIRQKSQKINPGRNLRGSLDEIPGAFGKMRKVYWGNLSQH